MADNNERYFKLEYIGVHSTSLKSDLDEKLDRLEKLMNELFGEEWVCFYCDDYHWQNDEEELQ